MIVEIFDGKIIKGGELLEIEGEIDISKINIPQNITINHYIFNSAKVDLEVLVGKNACYNLFIIQTTNDSKNNVKVKLLDKDAKADINIAYKLARKTKIMNDVLVEHLVPETHSNQLIKGVVDGEAKSDFHGKIHIAKDAIKTEGHQLHKALLLSDKGLVKCLPELEIFADDVKCSHGAATGVLDEMQLFYMCSRGISYEDAKQMLIDAYLDDVINKISNNEVQEWVKGRI